MVERFGLIVGGQPDDATEPEVTDPEAVRQGFWGYRFGMTTRADVGRTGRESVDRPRRPPGRTVRSWQQLGVALLVGVCGAVAASLGVGVNPAYAVLLAWVVAAVVYVGWVWRSSWPLGAEDTAAMAVREDPSRAIADAVLLAAAVASLVAVAWTIADADKAHGVARALRVALGVVAVISSWFLVHTLFTVKYARSYYDGTDGGVSFNMSEPPMWSDFAYLSFTVGMTFQVSDTDVGTSALRRLALRHMLISYLFGAVIIAVTINLVAGLAR